LKTIEPLLKTTAKRVTNIYSCKPDLAVCQLYQCKMSLTQPLLTTFLAWHSRWGPPYFPN